MVETTNPLRDCTDNTVSTGPRIEIYPLDTGDDPTRFRTLNEAWISQYFTLEETDREVLGNPREHIPQKGGQVFFLFADGEPVGCVALIPTGNAVFELSKMTITARMRGLDLGRKLLAHAITQSKVIGAKTLFLGNITKLQNAIHLYETVGFQLKTCS